MQSNITDSRAIPNACLDTDHRPVITMYVTQSKVITRNRKKQLEMINIHKLQNKEVQDQIRRTINERLDTINFTSLNVEQTWHIFKAALKDTLK